MIDSVDFQRRDAVLLGVTFSAADELRKWRDEVGLQCDLLSDADRAVGLAYGSGRERWDQEESAWRMSVLVGPDGKVVKVYPNPDVERHAREVLDDLDDRIRAAASA